MRRVLANSEKSIMNFTETECFVNGRNVITGKRKHESFGLSLFHQLIVMKFSQICRYSVFVADTCYNWVIFNSDEKEENSAFFMGLTFSTRQRRDALVWLSRTQDEQWKFQQRGNIIDPFSSHGLHAQGIVIRTLLWTFPHAIWPSRQFCVLLLPAEKRQTDEHCHEQLRVKN